MKQSLLFNRIANIYGLFYNLQVKNYRRILSNVKSEFDISLYQSAIDIGCGTGALCKALQEHGLAMTGLDPAEAMLAIAAKKTRKPKPFEPAIQFVQGDVLEGLPFNNQSFDIAITSYVAHGLMPLVRMSLYQEMKRVARHTAIFIDYNEQRSLLTDIIEWLEGGDYFNFIRSVKVELSENFGGLRVIRTGPRSAMYICNIEQEKTDANKRFT